MSDTTTTTSTTSTTTSSSLSTSGSEDSKDKQAPLKDSSKRFPKPPRGAQHKPAVQSAATSKDKVDKPTKPQKEKKQGDRPSQKPVSPTTPTTTTPKQQQVKPKVHKPVPSPATVSTTPTPSPASTPVPEGGHHHPHHHHPHSHPHPHHHHHHHHGGGGGHHEHPHSQGGHNRPRGGAGGIKKTFNQNEMDNGKNEQSIPIEQPVGHHHHEHHGGHHAHGSHHHPHHHEHHGGGHHGSGHHGHHGGHHQPHPHHHEHHGGGHHGGHRGQPQPHKPSKQVSPSVAAPVQVEKVVPVVPAAAPSKQDNLKMKQVLAESNEAKKKERADKKKDKRKEKERERREKRKQEKKEEKETPSSSSDSTTTTPKDTNKRRSKKEKENKNDQREKKQSGGHREEEEEEKSNNKNGEKGGDKRRRNRFDIHLSREDVQSGLDKGDLFYGTIRVNAKKFMDAYVTVDGSEHDCYVDGIKNRNRAFHTDIVVFKILPETEWKKRPSTEDEATQEQQEEEVASIKDSTSMNEDQGTIALPPFQSPSVPLRKSIAESQTFKSQQDDQGESSDEEEDDSSDESESESENDDDEEKKTDTSTTTLENQIEKLEIEDDFVIINNDNNSTSTTTTIIKSKRQPKYEDISGLKQDRLKLAALTLRAFKLNKYVSVKIVHILEAKHNKNHVGLVTEEGSTFALFTPLDQTLPRCLVFRETMPQEFRVAPQTFKTKLVSIQYGSWKESSMYPVGRFGVIFGECGDIEPETRALLKEYHVDTEPFSRDVMNCLPKLADAKDFRPSANDYKERRDLRDWIICSIDPDTAKDLDDALSCEELPDGNFRVGVHIADVSHFVTPDNALDKCAQEKATTVYLVQRAIPMLPSLLSEELCSLNYGVERFAFSVVWTMTKDGEILDEWFGRSVIKSASRLTYGVAQKIIEGLISTSWDQAMPKDDVKPILREKVSDAAVFMAMQMLSVRSMKLAEYFSTGDVDEDDWRHYALNVGHYTHFTSPIRRYPDIVVHRLLQLSIDLEKSDQASQAVREAEALRVRVEKDLPNGEWLTQISKHCNEKKMNSRKAQERSDKVFLCVLLENHPTECDAVIMAGGNTFIQVLVPMFGCEQRIYLADLKEKNMIIKDSYDGSSDENTITWPSIENNLAGSDPALAVTKKYAQLSTIRVLITVDKSKFPIDTKCTLLHPHHINIDSIPVVKNK
ncbi:Hypothetical ribonuclease II domain containing protein [Cavenderia fasciculata]|uniref:Hypothetical ribonuclease II domain containing protein n=1 Tax=Cavenderia fasciculata TaxID=261658 RepID=F4PJT2_CACFS|nr:putative ribonuclease II domain containing protein [Cavenderia fasciculata]EGG23856.1 Hypothetical ribonuclease II domain containing protein [Cavenderia fasciculata]|eukprot:XP_004361707.1 Hypothetical ribonuclease II domain containing protein [Cavenderia fasciculata]